MQRHYRCALGVWLIVGALFVVSRPARALSLKFGIESGVARIDGIDPDNDSQGRLLSNWGYGGNASLRLDLVRGWSLRLGGRYRKLSFFESDDRTLENSDLSLLSYGASVQWNFRRRLALEVRGGREDSVFYHATSETQVQVDKVGVPYAGIALRWILAITPKLGSDLLLGVDRLMGSETSAHEAGAGLGYNAALNLARGCGGRWSCGVSLEYRKKAQDSNVLATKSSEFLVGLTFGTRLGGRPK